jgi:hypothetical protein
MSQAEFERWFAFYQMHPFDDLHRYHRPAALIARTMAGGDIGEMLEWLHPNYLVDRETGYSEEDLRTFKALGLEKPPKRS